MATVAICVIAVGEY